jgi:GntR family transcriptional regulator
VISTATLAGEDEIATPLQLSPGDLVHEVVRVRLADGEPISLERASFPAARFPGLLDRSLSGSIYELLQSEYDLEPGEAEERIEVVSAGAAESRLLGVPRGAPLVAIRRTAWSTDQVPFERSHDLFRADRVRIVVRAKARSVVAASVEVV